jgi:flagellar biosynthetic protein FlhB
MAGGTDNKSEKPTRRRLEKARKKGQVARSREVPSAAVLFGTLLVLLFFGQRILHTLEFEMKYLLDFRLPSEITFSYFSDVFKGISIRTGIVLLPILLSVLAFSVVGNMVQGGLVFSTEALGFHFQKLNPKSGLKRIFSKNGIVQLVKSILVVAAVTVISYQVLSEHFPLYPRLVLMDVGKLFYWITSISFEIFIRVAVLLIAVAIADYAFQKYRFTEQLKMSKQEVKEEWKETEGDPITKGRIRRIQREMARKRMMADVATSDVVITNPTHYAVALSYKMETMDAPKVVAKGVGFLALKIRELAQEHDVPLVENKPLAQTLYKSVEVGESIPAGLYKAVAEILAYVYRAKNVLAR